MMESRRWEWLLGVVAGFVLAGFAALWIDVPLARWCLEERTPGLIKKVLHLAEVFGHGVGVVGILITVAVLDRERRWMLPRLALGSLGAGLLANLGKLFFARTRPHHAELTGGVAETFLGWFPEISRPSFEQGFPSSHVATAVGLAVCLSWLYPRGKYWFAMLAALVAAQRVEAGSHFVSDTLWGASVGFAIGSVAMRMPSLGYLGNLLEQRLGRQRPISASAIDYSPQSAANSRKCAMASSISGAAAPRTRP